MTKQQQLEALAKHDGGTSVADLSRELQISPATFYRRKKDHATEQNNTQRRLRELESANKRLKKIYAELGFWEIYHYLRNHGPEFISQQLRAWATSNGVEIKFIQPGKPTHNGLIERLNKTLRTERIHQTWLQSMAQLNTRLQTWSQVDNLIRPHQSLGHITPDNYKTENQKFYYLPVAA